MQQNALEQALWLCQLLGVPVAKLKMEGSATIIIFLGIELDTLARFLSPKGETSPPSRDWWVDRPTVMYQDDPYSTFARN